MLLREDVLEKVKKLFALASNNPSKEEAEIAALKAQELMAEYDLEMSEVNSVELEKTEDIAEVPVDVKAKKWKYVLAQIVAKNFKCKCYFYGTDVLVFYGHQTDAHIASETFKFLFNTGNKLGNKLAREARERYGYADNVYNSCVMGFCEGLQDALDEQSVALMVIVPEDVEARYAERSANFVKSTISAPTAYVGSAFNKGREAGYKAMTSNRISA